MRGFLERHRDLPPKAVVLVALFRAPEGAEPPAGVVAGRRVPKLAPKRVSFRSQDLFDEEGEAGRSAEGSSEGSQEGSVGGSNGGSAEGSQEGSTEGSAEGSSATGDEVTKIGQDASSQ